MHHWKYPYREHQHVVWKWHRVGLQGPTTSNLLDIIVCLYLQLSQSVEKETYHFTAQCTGIIVSCFPLTAMAHKKLAIWCPFECVSWVICKHCLIALGWEPIIRPTSLWNYYTSHTWRVKLLQQWTQKLCAVSPAWDETNDSCGHI